MKYPEDFINKIINGDCLEVMKNIPDNSVDMGLCDLPYYNVVKESWDNLWESKEEYLSWLEILIKEYNRVLKENSNIFLFTSRQCNMNVCAILNKYFIEKRIIIWARKRSFNTTRGKALASGYEPIAYYSKGDAVFNNIKIMPTDHRKDRPEYASGTLKDGICLTDVWDDIHSLPHNSKEKVDHPTQKPIGLIERIIKIGSQEGMIVLDTCAGSCTTAVACKTTRRQFICIEKEKAYCEIGRKRLELL